MLYSLAICTVLYVSITLVLTGMVPYKELGVADPLAYVFEKVGMNFIAGVISISAVVAITSALLVYQLGQPRIWMAMSRDGLLPKIFSDIHPRFKTPAFSTIITGLFVGIPSLFLNMQFVTDLTSVGTFFAAFRETVVELLKPFFTIGLVLGFAFIANYSGMSSTLGLAFAATGAFFPFFSPFLGWLGVFLTGSDTSSNALFANLQSVTAQQIGVDPTLTVAANTTGGVTGKMISPQSIAVACAATGLVGKESDLFRFTVKHSLFFALIIAVITYVQAYFLPWMIPVAAVN